MTIKFHEKLYRDGISDKKYISIKKKVNRKSPKINLFFIALPISNQGLLEIYWYPELLQEAYQKLETELVIVGIANSREEAFALVEEIITDIGVEGHVIPVYEYFKESE